jgi:DNA-binding SARP family transcriptional activator
MDFCLLGPLEVRDGERLIPIRRQKQRALLALLVLEVGRIVSTDRLLDELWGEEPPRTAKGSLHNSVSQLRRALGADVLLTRAPGYVLDVDRSSVDLVRFERLVEEARGSDDLGRAAKLREALAMWRGPPLAELAFEQFAQAAIQQLEEQRLATLEDRIDADLALGREAEVIGELERLAADNPLRERVRAQLMLALYRRGRQAEALEVFHDARRVLVDELGIEPSPALRELEQAVLRQDPSLVPVEVAPELRRTVTVLYAEFVTTTADGEELHDLTVRASQEVRAAVEYHGGTIERLTGDELTAVFGAPVAHEDDVVRASRAVLALREALASSTEPRAVIATGEVTIVGGSMRGGLSGSVIGLARRLGETARRGEILVEASAARQAGAALRTGEAATRSVRGRAEPVPVVALLGVETAPVRPDSEAPLIGRAAELEELCARYEQAHGGSRCVVAVVVGEPGIGKSRLAAELAESLPGGPSVLAGRCLAYGQGATFLPLAEIVAQAAAGRASGWIEQLLENDEDAGLIARRIADLGDTREPPSAPTGEVFWAVRRLLEGLARAAPVVLILEDVHWGEPTLLDLVEYLGRSSDEAPVFVVCLARPELLEQRPAWATGSIELRRLDDAAALELVEAAGGGSLADGDRARIAGLAEGNPLFAEQLVAYAIEKGSQGLDEVPPSLLALLSSRLDRLDEAERAVLQRASVIGREFWLGSLLHLTPRLEVPAAGRHLLELTRKGLIQQTRSALSRGDAFRFHHALIRDVAYGSIPAELCAELHERAADWLELQGPGQDEVVGYHLERAWRLRAELWPSDRRAHRLAADAGDRLATAGLRAARSGDTPAAANLLGRAGTLLTAAEAARRDVLSELGIVTWRGGDVAGAAGAFRRALETATTAGDRRAELRARLELANLGLFRNPEGGAAGVLSLAAEAIPVLEAFGDARALGRAWYCLSFLHGGLHCHYAQSTEAAERAATYFRDAGWSIAPCLQELAAGLYYGPTRVPAALARCRELLERADRGGEANVLAFMSGLEAMAGRFDEARVLVSRAQTIYEELAWTIYVWTNCATVAADIELLAGEDAEAELLLTDSCGRMEACGERAHLATQAAQLGEAVYRQGRYEEAAAWARVARAHAASDDAGAQFLARALEAKTLGRMERFDAAEDRARQAVALAGATDALSQHAGVLLDLAEVLRLGNRPADAAATIEGAVRLFDHKGDVAGARAARASLRELAPA